MLRDTAALPGGLLERVDFLQQLDEKLARARAGAGQAVFISGEAGIGKSALLEAFFARLPSGSLVARGFWWFVGELLFWKSQATAVSAADQRCPEPFRLALAQRWRQAAEAFRAHEMPYQEALMLLRAGRPGIKRAGMILESLGASRLLAKTRLYE